MNVHRTASAGTMKSLVATLLLLLSTPAVAAPSGGSLFRENCASCHGTRGAGDGPSAAKLKPKPADLTKSTLDQPGIADVVRNGKNSCPKWRSTLSEEEITAVAAFAKSLQQ